VMWSTPSVEIAIASFEVTILSSQQHLICTDDNN
jgi:hypothetical protein